MKKKIPNTKTYLWNEFWTWHWRVMSSFLQSTCHIHNYVNHLTRKSKLMIGDASFLQWWANDDTAFFLVMINKSHNDNGLLRKGCLSPSMLSNRASSGYVTFSLQCRQLRNRVSCIRAHSCAALAWEVCIWLFVK